MGGGEGDMTGGWGGGEGDVTGGGGVERET